MHIKYLLFAAASLIGISAAPTVFSAELCQNADNLLKCAAQVEFTETVPSQAAAVQQYSMRKFANHVQEFEWLDGTQQKHLLVLQNGLILRDVLQPPIKPCLSVALFNLEMDEWSDRPLITLMKALGEGAKLPVPGQPFEAEYHGFWEYGTQNFRVKLEALTATKFHFDIVKTAIKSSSEAPATAAKIDNGACPGPRISSDEAAERIKSGKHFDACQIVWEEFDNSDEEAASLAKLPPVGQHISGSFDLEASPPLPDDYSLAMWRTEEGKQYATIPEARQQKVDQERILQQCGLK